jgi:hydroxylaminobenzene mutase
MRGFLNMNTQIEDRGRHILMHGLLLVMVELIWGFAVPLAPYPRLALGAHIQFVTNGMLFIVMSILLLRLPNNAGPKSATVMLAAAYMTWLMALSEAANAWWGANQMLPIAAGQSGATGGEAWQEWIVKLTHLAAGFSLLTAWGLLVSGFLRKPSSKKNAEFQVIPSPQE